MVYISKTGKATIGIQLVRPTEAYGKVYSMKTVEVETWLLRFLFVNTQYEWASSTAYNLEKTV